MSLQLYQVDQKSFLLDFKSLLEPEEGGLQSMQSQGSIDTGMCAVQNFSPFNI